MGGQSLYDDLAYVKLELDNVAWLQCEGAWSRQSYGHCRTLINLLSLLAFPESLIKFGFPLQTLAPGQRIRGVPATSCEAQH